MINLLPDDTKREMRAARMNVVLLRYNILVTGAIGALAAFCLLFYFILESSQSSAVSTSNDNSIKAESYASVKIAANEYRTNLAIAKQIIDKGVDYTSFIFKLTKLLPDGVVLDSVTLNAADFGSQTTFTAHVKDYAAASKLKSNFEKSDLFTNVYFQTLQDSSDTSGSQKIDYPITLTISVKINKVLQ